MSVLAASTTVATTATALATADSSVYSLLIKVPSGGATVYIGSSAVTTSTGFPVAAGEAYAFDLDAAETVYGVVASGTQAVNVLRTGI